MRVISIAVFMLFSSTSFAAIDVVRIAEVFSTTDGRSAFMPVDVPTAAVAENGCTTATHWMGFVVNDNSKSIVGIILAAHALGTEVQVNSSGCLG